MAASPNIGGTSNSNQWSISRHPLEIIAQGIQSDTSAEYRGNRVSHLMSSNEGPADIIAKVSSIVSGGKRVDDGPYFTNNEGIPFPHPKNIGGIPVASDIFLITVITPVGWRFNHGYGYHSFKSTDQKGEFAYIKYHFIVKHGQKQFGRDEAIKWSVVKWTAKVQVMKLEEADPGILRFDSFGVTKAWPRDKFPIYEFCRLVLNKNPENFHRDVEQAAFSPRSMVPGIGDSPDSLLQFRMFFYRDAQYHRVGVNLRQVPVNCSFMSQSLSSLNVEGKLRVDAYHASNRQYTPNSFAHKFRTDATEPAFVVSDNICSPDLLRLVKFPLMQKKYLSRVCNIAPEYAQGIYTALLEKKFQFSEVEELSKNAHL
ncbi:catalase-like domain-containing protein [Xylaria cf. heliscus]|nr:catalase-like domain-containing protein [Xylaria cf. heliscus]